MKKSRNWPEIAFAAFILAVTVGWGVNLLAADNQGALTLKNSVAEAYHANAETAAFVTLDGTDTLTGLEDPVAKFTAARIFRLHNDQSVSVGTKSNLKIQCKFSASAVATADLWVVYYYVDPAVPATYHITALSRPLAGTISATAAQDGALFLAEAAVEDGLAATHCVVFSDSVSAGTVAIWLGSY